MDFQDVIVLLGLATIASWFAVWKSMERMALPTTAESAKMALDDCGDTVAGIAVMHTLVDFAFRDVKVGDYVGFAVFATRSHVYAFAGPVAVDPDHISAWEGNDEDGNRQIYKRVDQMGWQRIA